MGEYNTNEDNTSENETETEDTDDGFEQSEV